MLNFEDVLKSNQWTDLKFVELSSIDYKIQDDVELLTIEESLAGNFVPVCNNVVWVASTQTREGETTYISSDGVHMFMYPPNMQTMMSWELSESGRRNLIANTRLTYKQPEPIINNIYQEETNMNNQASANPSSIDDLIQGVSNDVTSPPAGTIETMSAFDGPEAGSLKAKDPTKEAQKAAVSKIMSDLKETGAANDEFSLLKDCWIKNARHFCWITYLDSRDAIVASKVSQEPSEYQLVPNAPEDIKTLFKTDPRAVPQAHIQKVYKIEAKRSKPGATAGAIIKVPAYLKGKSVQEYMSAIATQGPKTDQESLATFEILKITDYEQKLALAGTVIKEDPATHEGVQSELSLVYSVGVVSKKSDSLAKGTVIKKKFVRTGNGNKTVFTNRNYFPLATYETYNIYEQQSPEVIDMLNTSYFETMINGTAASPGKYRSLSTDEQAMIRKDGDKIESDFITAGAGGRRLTIREFFDKEKERDTIRLPIKRRSEKPGANGKPPALSFVKYSLMADPKVLDGPEYKSKTSLGNGNFAHIVEAVPAEILDPAILKEMFKRGSGSSSTSKVLDSVHARAIVKAKITGGSPLSSYNVSGFED